MQITFHSLLVVVSFFFFLEAKCEKWQMREEVAVMKFLKSNFVIIETDKIKSPSNVKIES